MASAGQQAALTGVSSTQAVTLLLYVVHLFGMNDMPPEVAAAIIGLAYAAAGGIMHYFSTKRLKHASRSTDNPQPETTNA